MLLRHVLFLGVLFSLYFASYGVNSNSFAPD
nr:MAG TPA: hypothetical protein [Caudoviricetes sp.]DAU88666.1 MAG TPA: hypothetical protein [Caudoviricetes sp.]